MAAVSATAAVPLIGALIGFIAGIVFMARSKVGPALALWATSFLAALVWTSIGWLVLFTWAWQDVSRSADVPAVLDTAEEPEEPGPESSDVQPAAGAPDAERNTSANRSQASKSCGNLNIAATSTSCAFAHNVFYEYWSATNRGQNHVGRIRAYSSALSKWLEVGCEEGNPVVCMTDAGAEVRVPSRALADYTQAAADSYAASHTVSE